MIDTQHYEVGIIRGLFCVVFLYRKNYFLSLSFVSFRSDKRIFILFILHIIILHIFHFITLISVFYLFQIHTLRCLSLSSCRSNEEEKKAKKEATEEENVTTKSTNRTQTAKQNGIELQANMAWPEKANYAADRKMRCALWKFLFCSL